MPLQSDLYTCIWLPKSDFNVFFASLLCHRVIEVEEVEVQKDRYAMPGHTSDHLQNLSVDSHLNRSDLGSKSDMPLV